MKRIILLTLFLAGIIHTESFGQSNQNIDPLRFKVDSDILYEYYANNKSELARIRMLIETHTEDILQNKGYFQLVAYLPKDKSDDPTTLNQAAYCASVVRGWVRNQSPSLSKMTCAFWFSTSESRNIEVSINYISTPINADTPQAIYYTASKSDSRAIEYALSKYGKLPFIVTAKSADMADGKESENSSQQNSISARTYQRLLSSESSGEKTTMIIPDFIIYFRVNKSTIDPTYMNNAEVLEWMDRIVADRNIQYIDSLIISAYASPEAPSAYNKALSERRANAVRDYFLKRFALLKPDIVHAYGHGENWEGLRQLVEEDPKLPMKSEVLSIIDSNIPEDQRELKLKSLQKGSVYRYIYSNLYPRLRLGASLNVMLTEAAPDLHSLIFGPAFKPLAGEPLQVLLPPYRAFLEPIEPIQEQEYRYPIAFRTNLLYDGVGALNIGVEVPFGKKKNWSVIGDMAYSYWRSPKNLYALQTLEYGLESRYWFGVSEKRKERNENYAQPLKGFYVGLYGSYWQRYDVQFIDGYQGDNSWSAGLTAGYAVPLNRSLSFDFGIGAGWFSTSQYRHYHEPEYDINGKYHLMWQETGIWSGLSITKLRFSLVWMIRTSKQQERRPER